MAEVFHRVHGMEIQRFVALIPGVQVNLRAFAAASAAHADVLLREHRHDGHARIELEDADVDFHVILSDERGLKAAMSIEYGRRADEHGKGAMEGLFILHKSTQFKPKFRGI